MNYTNLFQSLLRHKNQNLLDFLNSIQMTEDTLVKIICEEEQKYIYSKMKSKNIFSPTDTAKLLKISYHTLRRHSSNIEAVPSTQKKEKSPIFYTLRHLSMQLYIVNNPIVPGETSFSKLFEERFIEINRAKFNV